MIAPTPSGDLTGADATVGTVRGDVTVAWSTGGTVCGLGLEATGQPALLNCSEVGGTIDAIVFANFGTTTGSCHRYIANCTGDDSVSVVKKACLGQTSCIINASRTEFAHGSVPYDPCPGVLKTLAIEARCSALFHLQISLPVGVSATVKLPLNGHSVDSVNITESGKLIWQAGSYKPGVAAAVFSATPWSDLTGRGVEVEVGSGDYSFVATL